MARALQVGQRKTAKEKEQTKKLLGDVVVVQMDVKEGAKGALVTVQYQAIIVRDANEYQRSDDDCDIKV